MDILCQIREITPCLAIADVSGAVDLSSAPLFDEHLSEALSHLEAAGCNYYDLVVNLANLQFIDTAGLGVLVGLQKRARSQKGSVSIIFQNPNIRKTFELVGLNNTFKFLETEEEAMQFFIGKLSSIGK